MTFLGMTEILVISCACLASCVFGQDPNFWNNQAQASIDEALNIQLDTNPAKNVIVFLGDGLDISTTVASRIREGQRRGADGESNVLSWETFPHDGLTKTYSTDMQVSDSASSGTAIFGGVKTKNGVIGLDDTAKRGDCASASGNGVNSLLHQANSVGKATGFVTTDSVTGASTAALYAHTPERAWHSNADIPLAERDCSDIAFQLVQDNDFINVILGGGRQEFIPKTIEDPEYAGVKGRRTDGNYLIGQWSVAKPLTTSSYVWGVDDFNAVDTSKTDYLLGLFEPANMRYAADRASDGAGEPSLADMTKKSIEILRKDTDGYFLVVESALIDFSHHAGLANDALSETIELADAVTMATQMTNRSDTLIIVTSDHAHTMGIMGYPSRNNPILGLVDDQESRDDIPYTTLTYVNGPGGTADRQSWKTEEVRRNYSDTDTESRDFVQEAIVPLDAETHGGSDVAVYAMGPWSHLFSGVHEQNYIAHAIRHAACLDAGSSSACN